MADALYDLGRQKFLEGDIAWLTDTIQAHIVTSGYVPNLTTDEFVSDLGANILTDGTGTLAGKSSTNGVADAADTVLSAVSAGQTGAAIVLAKDTGNVNTSPLVAYIDSYTGLPVSTNGEDVTIRWPNDANAIFKL